MWRSKKLFIAAILAAVTLAGSIGGAVLASDNEDDSQPEAECEDMLNRVCEIYEEKTGVAIDPEILKDSFAQVTSEKQMEALEAWLETLVEEGVITQEQADQYQEWMQWRPLLLATSRWSSATRI
ncbi:hypothetical protein ACFLW0_04605 [Chloroflexota bacterium]